mmetsp:Transcript_4169/g.14579  ORF Transcript_4169/g.14579 Transcript_4169/m.14579 type:complete len:241 (-) Transcript_4169:707-1429(-)
MLPKSNPALVIVSVHRRGGHGGRRELGKEVGLEHEGHCVPSDVVGLLGLVGGLLEGRGVRPVRAHARVKRGPAGQKSALLCLVLPVDQSHELAHAVPVVVRGPECVLSDRPARREDHEVRNRGPGLLARAGQHREDGGVRVVEVYSVHRTKIREVVLVRRVVSVPCDNVVGRKVLVRAEELPVELVDDLVGPGLAVPLKPRDWGLEVLRVGQAVRANGAQVRKRKVPLEDLQDVAAGGLA